MLGLAKQKKYELVEFILENKLNSNLGTQDEDGNTLLHYVVSDYAALKLVKVLDLILANPNVKSFISIQNKTTLDTPLHLAVKAGNSDLADRLIQCGADPSIKNKDGDHIVTEAADTERMKLNNEEIEKMNTDAATVQDDGSKPADLFTKVNVEVNVPQGANTQQVVGSMDVIPAEAIPASSPVTASRNPLMTEQTLPQEFLAAEQKVGGMNTDTEAFLGKLMQKMSTQKGGKVTKHSSKKNRMTDSEQLAQTINSHLGAPTAEQVQKMQSMGFGSAQAGGAYLDSEQLARKINDVYGTPVYSDMSEVAQKEVT